MARLKLCILTLILTEASFASNVLTDCGAVSALPPLLESDRRPVALECQVQDIWAAKPDSDNVHVFVADENGGTSLWGKRTDGLRPGDCIRLTGFARNIIHIGNVVVATNLTVVGHRPPKKPEAVTLGQIKDGSFDSRFVSTAGTVIDSFPDELDARYHWLLLHNEQGDAFVSTESDSSLDATRFIGQQVAVTGLCTTCGSGKRRFIGSRIHVQRMSEIKIEADDQPCETNAPSLEDSYPRQRLQRRYLDGTVIATWDSQNLFLLTESGRTFEVRLRAGHPLPSVGTRLGVSGFTDTDNYYVRLIQATCTTLGLSDLSVPPADITARQLLTDGAGNPKLDPEFHGRVIRLTGTVKTEPAVLSKQATFHLECDNHLIPIVIPAGMADTSCPEPGSVISATGVCHVEFDSNRSIADFPRIKGFSLILRSPKDIAVLATPPWWTPLRLMIVIGILLVVLVAILLWNRTLRIVAERRGRELMVEQLGRVSADLKVGERTRLAVELHDALSQNLTGVSLQLDAVRRFADEDRGKMTRHLDMAMRTLKSSRDELRNCLWDLRNRALEEKDMNEAIRRTASPFVGDAALLIRFNVPRDQISDNTAHALMRIVRELATNAVRHGRAKSIRIAGALENGRLLFSVSDDGNGFDLQRQPGVAEGHFGLDGIRDRVSRFDGKMEIESAPGRGATIRISMTA